MIDIKNAEEIKSRFKELSDKYRETTLPAEQLTTVGTHLVLVDISKTLALIYDEMRGVKNDN